MAALFLAVFIMFTAFPVQAEEEKDGVKSSTDLEFLVSSRPEMRLGLSQSFMFPFLQGTGPWTKDNNITAILTAQLSPISITGIGEVRWTPAAFLQLSGGGELGSGWNMAMGDGIGIFAPEDENPPGPGDPPRRAKIYGSAFDGLQWSTWGAATLQFDLGAVIPGDWTHVFFQVRQGFRYSAYTRAGSGESWVYLNDDRDNQNGWKYQAAYILGYHMPKSPVLDTIAFTAVLDKSLYNSPGGDKWGDGLGKWTFSGLFNFSINSRLSSTLAIQLRTRYNYDTTNFENYDYYYRDFELSSNGGQRRLVFYRAVVILNYKIR